MKRVDTYNLLQLLTFQGYHLTMEPNVQRLDCAVNILFVKKKKQTNEINRRFADKIVSVYIMCRALC